MKYIVLIIVSVILGSCSYLNIFNQEDENDIDSIFLLLGLSSSGRSTVSNELNFAPGEKLDINGDGSYQGTLIDSNDDGISNGIDLTGNGIIDIDLIDSNGDGKPDAVDVSGNGEIDYYINPNGNPLFSTEPNGGGNAVILLKSEDGEVLGFDTTGDGSVNDNSIAIRVNNPIQLIETPSILTYNGDLLVRWKSTIAGEYSVSYGTGGTIRENIGLGEISNMPGTINPNVELNHNHMYVGGYYHGINSDAQGRIRLVDSTGTTHERFWNFRIETMGPIKVEAVGIISGSFSFLLDDSYNQEEISFTEDGVYITDMLSIDGSVLSATSVNNSTGRTCDIDLNVNSVNIADDLVNVRVTCVD